MKRVELFLLVLGLSLSVAYGASEIEASFTTTDSPIDDILWCGLNKDVLIVLTEASTVYRSDNRGFTWKRLQDYMTKAGLKEVEDDEVVGKVSRMEISPADENLIFFFGTHGINWVSEDCGKTVKAFNHGRKLHEFEFHPTERTWGLAATWTRCDDFVDEPCQIYKELYVTKDLGVSWKFIDGYVVQFSWGAVDPIQIKKGIPKSRIYMTFEPNGKGHQKLSGWSHKVDFVVSDDFFTTRKTLVPKGNKFYLTTDYLFAAQVTDQAAQEVALYVSSMESLFSSFHQIELPLKKVKDHSYTILDTSEGAVFLHINHFGEGSPYGSLYTSDYSGRRYALSLKHHIRNLDGQTDFEKVLALQGIYIANAYSDDAVQVEYNYEAAQKKSNSKSSKKKKGAQTSSESSENSELNRKIKDLKRTLITFNKGGKWAPLAAPEKDSQNKKIICQDEDCSLHLHSYSMSRYAPFYTAESAIGLIMGTGNVGYHLKDRPDEINTYLSRDGGLTWFEVKKGSFIYEFGDHGALIVMAQNTQATDKVIYSWNEGLSWSEAVISDYPFEITNIVIEPKSISQYFLVYGTMTDEKNNKKGVLAALDFSKLHEPQCKGAATPDDPQSDYETWSPYDGRHGEACLLGRKITYVRRKRDVECYNGEEFDRATSIHNCECTEEDYECDIGFYRTKGGSCSPLKNTTKITTDPPADCKGGSYYYVTQGYRKVAGDSCVGGVNHNPLEFKCPSSMSILFSFPFILGFLVIGGVIGFFYYTDAGNEYFTKAKDILAGQMERAKSQKEKGKYAGLGQLPESMDDEDVEFRGDADGAELLDHETINNQLNEESKKKGGRELTNRRGVDTAARNLAPLRQQPGGRRRDDEEEDEAQLI